MRPTRLINRFQSASLTQIMFSMITPNTRKGEGAAKLPPPHFRIAPHTWPIGVKGSPSQPLARARNRTLQHSSATRSLGSSTYGCSGPLGSRVYPFRHLAMKWEEEQLAIPLPQKLIKSPGVGLTPYTEAPTAQGVIGVDFRHHPASGSQPAFPHQDLIPIHVSDGRYKKSVQGLNLEGSFPGSSVGVSLPAVGD